jgi:hypothetical protein
MSGFAEVLGRAGFDELDPVLVVLAKILKVHDRDSPG